MRRRRSLAALAAAALAAGAAPASAAVDARLDGTFSMRGVVTRAHNVRGERHGQVVTRRWTFTAACPAGPCSQVTLTRRRSGGTDRLTLTQTGPGTYAGTSAFYVPVLCRGVRVPRGGKVPFTISVAITAAPNGVASAIEATYTNRSRVNLTHCRGGLGHDAARYTGRLSG
jgi:hypothetical protein